MDELANDECDGHKNYSLDESGEGKMERSSSNSLGEKSNEEGNEKRTKEWSEEGNEKKELTHSNKR